MGGGKEKVVNSSPKEVKKEVQQPRTPKYTNEDIEKFVNKMVADDSNLGAYFDSVNGNTVYVSAEVAGWDGEETAVNFTAGKEPEIMEGGFNEFGRHMEATDYRHSSAYKALAERLDKQVKTKFGKNYKVSLNVNYFEG